MNTTVFDFSAIDIRGEVVRLSAFRGRPSLIVNVASYCGFTPQYAGLEALWRQYEERGFVVLGFPCNQFGAQEPDDEATIARFCAQQYGVTFPLFARVEVNGEGAHPLFAFLKSAVPGVMGSEAIKWNFTKFLADRTGRPVGRFAPTTTPDELAPKVEALL